MVTLISSILAIYVWGVICTLLLFLLSIGRFYQEKSGHRSFYQIFLIPVCLFAISAIGYAQQSPMIVGNFWGDILRFIGGVVLGGAGLFLLRLMMGGRS